MSREAQATAPSQPPDSPRVAAAVTCAPVVVVIPALDEAETIAGVLAELRAAGVERAVVVDNGSRDATATVALAHGATVVRESRRGYGAAVARGLEEAADDEIVLFVNADGSDDPRDLEAVVGPVAAGLADLVVGSRVLGTVEPGALTPVQRFGNWLATRLLGWIFGVRLTDLGPFRAARASTLRALGIRDRGFGWTVEMEARALRAGLRVVEVSVSYRRRRGGRSKISGTIVGSVRAGVAIINAVARARFEGPGRERGGRA